MNPQSIEDLARIASRRLPHFLSEYIGGGSFAEQTLARNVDDLRNIRLRQRVLRDVSNAELTTDLFGQEFASPIGLGPVGMSGMFARRGEVQAAVAAERADIPFCLSALSVCSVEELCASLSRSFWFQLYMIKDRGFMRELLDRVRAAGCTVLLFTVDMPVPAIRYRDFRSGMSGNSGFRGGLRLFAQTLLRPRWLYNVGLRGRPHTFGNLAPVLGKRSGLNDYVSWIGENFDASTSWRHLDWVRTSWTGPLVIKGVLDVDDAKQAVASGADGIVISNHGGRQFDGVCSTAHALPLIARAVGEELTILVDGGVRSGIDVLRMLALGARGVLLGRAWAYALAAGGSAAVESMIETVNRELAAGMAMAGCTRVSELDRTILDIAE